MLVESPRIRTERRPGCRAPLPPCGAGAGLLAALCVLAVIATASVAVGARAMSLDQVWHGLFHYTGTVGDVVVHDVRVPRTLLGLLVGVALGLSGAVMQALTRNPLAEPGILGVNAGAAARSSPRSASSGPPR